MREKKVKVKEKKDEAKKVKQGIISSVVDSEESFDEHLESWD